MAGILSGALRGVRSAGFISDLDGTGFPTGGLLSVEGLVSAGVLIPVEIVDAAGGLITTGGLVSTRDAGELKVSTAGWPTGSASMGTLALACVRFGFVGGVIFPTGSAAATTGALALVRFGFSGVTASTTGFDPTRALDLARTCFGSDGVMTSGGAFVTGLATAIFRDLLAGVFFAAVAVLAFTVSASALVSLEAAFRTRGFAAVIFFGFFIATVLTTGVARSSTQIKRGI